MEDEIHLLCSYQLYKEARYVLFVHFFVMILPNGRFGQICVYDEQYAEISHGFYHTSEP